MIHRVLCDVFKLKLALAACTLCYLVVCDLQRSMQSMSQMLLLLWPCLAQSRVAAHTLPCRCFVRLRSRVRSFTARPSSGWPRAKLHTQHTAGGPSREPESLVLLLKGMHCMLNPSSFEAVSCTRHATNL